jgi:MFS family permease
LTVPDFRNFYAGQFLSFTGTWMRRTALGWLVFDLTESYDKLGMVTALMVLPLLLFSPWAGMLADQFPKKKLLFITNIFLALFSFLLAGSVLFNVVTINLLYVLAFASGTAFAFEVPIRQSFIKELIGEKLLLNGIALNSASVNLSRILGPLLAGLILAMSPHGYVIVFCLDALSYVAVMVTLKVIRSEGKPMAQTHSGFAHFAQGFQAVYQARPVLMTMILLFLLGVFGWSYQTLLPGIAQEQFGFAGHDAYLFGILTAIFGIGASIGAILVATYHARLNPMKSLYAGLLCLSLSLFIMSFTQNYYWFAAMQFPAGFGSIFFLSMANTVVQTGVPDNVRGRVMGIWSLAFGGSLPLGSWLIGYAAEWYGPFHSLLLFTIILFVFLHFIALSGYLFPRNDFIAFIWGKKRHAPRNV